MLPWATDIHLFFFAFVTFSSFTSHLLLFLYSYEVSVLSSLSFIFLCIDFSELHPIHSPFVAMMAVPLGHGSENFVHCMAYFSTSLFSPLTHFEKKLRKTIVFLFSQVFFPPLGLYSRYVTSRIFSKVKGNNC